MQKPHAPHLYGMLWLSVAYSFSISHSPPFHNCCLMASRKRKTRSTNQGWGWTEFTEHPGYECSDSASMVQQKAKVICTRQLKHYVAAERAHDELEVQFGSRDHIQDEDTIKGAGKLKLYHLSISNSFYCSVGYWPT